jgi:opacity protein-like surface antigen
MKARSIRVLGAACLPLLTGIWTSASAAEGPRYSYFGAAYQWSDVNYAIKQEGGQHEGVHLDGSLGVFDSGDFGLQLIAEYFDGDFTGFGPDQDSTSYGAGIGISYSVTDAVDLVARGQFINAELDSIDDDGYSVEGAVLGQIAENVELEVGYRYSDLKDSDISNNDVILSLGYQVYDWLTLRGSGVVFDDDTGIELGVRAYFGDFMGGDSAL